MGTREVAIQILEKYIEELKDPDYVLDVDNGPQFGLVCIVDDKPFGCDINFYRKKK